MKREEKVQLLKDLWTGRKSIDILKQIRNINLDLFEKSELNDLFKMKKKCAGDLSLLDADEKQRLKELSKNYSQRLKELNDGISKSINPKS